MESRNLKQRGRGAFNDEDTLPFTSNEYNKEKQRISAGAGAGTGGLDPAHFEAAHGAVSKAYGAYPAIASDRWDGAGDGESLTDFSEVRMDAGVNGVLRSRDFVITAILTLLSLFTRLYKIGRRPNVTWDEAHFGKFGAFYINHTFYHDVHPPLAKMLVGLAEVIAGHNGTFKFGSGDKYPEYVDYTFIRAQLALYGAALVPLAYLTCRH
ncbi:Protein O-mannosyltransferase 2, partial [Kickxella alabastrina]